MSSVAQLPSTPLVASEPAGERAPYVEQRKSARLPLQWAVYVARAGAPRPLRSKTSNLSSRGFYCVLPERLTVGERVECDLILPEDHEESEGALFLRCQARVVRVVDGADACENDGYGLACHIEDYCLMRRSGTGKPEAPDSFAPDADYARSASLAAGGDGWPGR